MEVQTDPSVYKIISVYDDRVLDVKSGDNETQIITWSYHGGPNQLWQASLRGEGVVLASLDQVPNFPLRVIEQCVEDGKVHIYDDQKSVNQKWFLQEVDKTKRYIIWSMANNKCLQNNGNGKQVTAVDPKAIKSRHEWKIERTSHPN